MYKKTLGICVIAFVIGILAFNFSSKTSIMSSDFPVKGMRELVNDSDVILYGEVLDILESKWSNPNYEKGEHISNIIVTDVLVKIKKVYKGIPYHKKEVVVRVAYGQVGGATLIYNDEPSFIVGEETILFLREPYAASDDLSEDYYFTTGLLQGKFSLFEETENDKIYQNGTIADKIKLSTAEKEIKDIMKDLEKNPLKRMTREEVEELNKETLGE